MTRNELIDRLAAQQSQLTTKEFELAVKLVLETVANALAEGRRVEIRGFGSFSLNHRPPRQGRNPKTGQLVPVPAKSAPHFKPGKDLRARVVTPR